MVDNEDFLHKVLLETGQTNLREVFLNYLQQKEKKYQESLVPKNVMMPAELIQAPKNNESLATGVSAPKEKNNPQNERNYQNSG